MAADFSALDAKGGDNMLFGHAPNLGADPIHFLWQLRHNTGFFQRCAARNASMISPSRCIESYLPSDVSTPAHPDCDPANRKAEKIAVLFRPEFRRTPWSFRAMRRAAIDDDKEERSRTDRGKESVYREKSRAAKGSPVWTATNRGRYDRSKLTLGEAVCLDAMWRLARRVGPRRFIPCRQSRGIGNVYTCAPESYRFSHIAGTIFETRISRFAIGTASFI